VDSHKPGALLKLTLWKFHADIFYSGLYRSGIKKAW
jgi:hypothetical protein